MIAKPRVVADTNVIVSRLLVPRSVPARAIAKAIDTAQLLVSYATLQELVNVLSRPKFDPYVTIAERQEFLRLLLTLVDNVSLIHAVRACRDPADDKFLEVAVNGEASAIITGDRDLLTLHPFRGIAIVTPADYLAR